MSAPTLRNLGPASWVMLARAGICCADDLRQCGAVPAFLAVQATGAKPSLNLLWALEGALTDRDWKVVAKTERTRLLMALDDVSRSKTSSAPSSKDCATSWPAP